MSVTYESLTDKRSLALVQRTYTLFILTSKILFAEARGTLQSRNGRYMLTSYTVMMYSTNKFLFRTKTPLPEGTFGYFASHVLCDIGTIRLVTERDLQSTRSLDAHRHSLKRFVKTIKEHSTDERRKPLLRQLKLDLRLTDYDDPYQYDFSTAETN